LTADVKKQEGFISTLKIRKRLPKTFLVCSFPIHPSLTADVKKQEGFISNFKK
jgi:hypothetical protein